MATNKPVLFMDYVRLPLLLSVLTAGLFYIWPQEVASGFDDMMKVIKILARPTQQPEIVALKTQQVEQPAQTMETVQPTASIEWTNEPPPGEGAQGNTQESSEQAQQNHCRKAQENYIDEPSEDNKAAVGLACNKPSQQ